MGAFKWIKRAFFGAESLAKSGVEKGKEASEQAYDVTREKLVDIKEELSESVVAAKDKFDDLFDKVTDKAKDGIATVKEKVSDASEGLHLDEAKETGKRIVASGKEIAADAADKLGQASEQIVEASDQAWDKITKTSSNLFDKVKEKAEDIGSKVNDKMDDMLEKAETLKEEERIEDAKHPTGIYEGESHNEKLEGSLFDGTDDFFAKAAAFAEGDYEKASEGKMTIQQTEPPAKIDDRPVAGFVDGDGDGDEIMDDAIVLEEE